MRTLLISGSVMLLLTACERAPGFQSRALEVFPPVTIEKAALYRIDHQAVTPAFFQGRWSAVVFGDVDCADACQKHLHELDQIQDVRSLFVIEGVADAGQLRKLAQQFPRVAIGLGASAVSFDAFARQFETSGKSRQDWIYLVNAEAELVWQLSVADLVDGDIQSEFELLTN